MVLELDPRYPMLWRSETALQFGVDRPVAVLEAVGYAAELMIDALRVGTSGTTVRLIGSRAGAAPETIEAILDALGPVLRRRAHDASAPGPAVLVDGTGPTATSLRTILRAEGCRIVDGDGVEPALVVLVAAFAIAPAGAARWLRADIPHLAVVFGDETVRIGPLVDPGVGPCLHCLDRQRVDVDPAWPRLVVQLIGRAAPTETALGSGFVAAAVADLVLRHLSGARELVRSARIHRDASGAFTEVALRPHPECGCRSLAGSATAPAGSSARSPTATTTGEGAAVPA